MDPSFEKYIAILKKEIEGLLAWGKSEEWTNKDFENLKEKIFLKTNNALSVSTLKRVWGRTEQKATPSITTLDILSQFADHKSWRAFRKNVFINKKEAKNHHLFKGFSKYMLIFIPVFLILLVILSYIGNSSFSINNSALQEKFQAVEFDYEKVTIGYPNTVVFKYDVKDLAFDSLSIQQSWDTSKRIPLADGKGIRTSTYLFPGYFLTKLVWNEKIIKEKELYIPTLGWQGAVTRNNGEIHYLEDEIIVKDGVVTTNYMEQKEDQELYLAYLNNDPFIHGSDFELNSSFRITKKFDHSTCSFSRIIVTGTKEVISLNFSIPGCVGALNNFINMKFIQGRNTDLSGFGVEKNQFIQCNLKMKDNVLEVYLEDKLILKDSLASDIGKIGGAQFWFDGIGEINQLTIKDDKNEINLLEQH